MFLRLRWFVLGVASAFGVVGFLATQVKRARERITARNLARSGVRSVAGILDSTADRLDGRRSG